VFGEVLRPNFTFRPRAPYSGGTPSREEALKEEISLSEARRIAVTAQGFNGLSRAADVGAAALPNAIRRLGLLQIDSVNVLVRAHYLPLFSRLGAYDRAALDALAAAKSKPFLEYWGHEASLLPVDLLGESQMSNCILRPE